MVEVVVVVDVVVVPGGPSGVSNSFTSAARRLTKPGKHNKLPASIGSLVTARDQRGSSREVAAIYGSDQLASETDPADNR